MKDEPEDLRSRTKRFALSIIQLSTRLPRTEEVSILRRQLLRSATSVAAHYREACRARSNAEFISKLEGGLQELDESQLWLELLIESMLCDWPQTRELLDETNEIIGIFVTIVRGRKDK
jgi:four helix bundle protein